MNKEIEILTNFCKKNLDLQNAVLSKEYSYNHLSLCIIDTIYGLNANYKSVQNVISRYCDYAKLEKYGGDRKDKLKQQSISKFIKLFEHHNPKYYAEEIFKNRRPTSSRSGILRAEAIYLFAAILKKHNVETFQDVKKIFDNDDIDNELQGIPGLGNAGIR